MHMYNLPVKNLYLFLNSMLKSKWFRPVGRSMLAVELMRAIIGAIIRPTRLRSSRGIGQWVTWLLQSSWLRSRDSSYVIVQTVDHYCPFEYFLNFWVQILEKEMMHGKSGNTVNRGQVNRELYHTSSLWSSLVTCFWWTDFLSVWHRPVLLPHL